MLNSKNISGQLADLCETLRELVYVDRNAGKAKKQLGRLESLLEQLPDDDGAVISAEAFALYHELKGNPDEAIRYRRREVELMEELYEDIRVNNYDEETRRFVLQGRDANELELRKAIILGLEQRLS